MSVYKSTGELFARRFQHLDLAWVDMVNEEVGTLKEKCSGNGEMHTLWNGGRDHGTKWTFSIPKRPQYHKPLQ